jgi:hypothetical protein
MLEDCKFDSNEGSEQVADGFKYKFNALRIRELIGNFSRGYFRASSLTGQNICLC